MQPNENPVPALEVPVPRNRLALKPITPKELEILRLIGKGLRNKEISIQASIAQNTVKVHLRRIFQKLGVSTRADAASVAVQRGLIE